MSAAVQGAPVVSPTYSMVVPIYNDGMLTHAFCAEFQQFFRSWLGKQDISADVELLFVNDGSRNDSSTHLAQVAAKHSFVKVIELSRNFGQHIALSAGFRHAVGQYVGMINVDMEEHPSQIGLILDEFKREPADLVLSLRPDDSKRAWHLRASSLLFNWTLNKLTGSNQPLNAGTLRIMSRRFVDAYNSLVEKNRFLPGLQMWLGFRQRYVKITWEPRKVGKSSYNLSARLKLAGNSIISFSDLPLRIAVAIGVAFVLAGAAMNVYLLGLKLFAPAVLPGFTMTVSLIIFFGGIQIFVIGLASLYIGRILSEVQGRPLYLIANRIGFPAGSDT